MNSPYIKGMYAFNDKGEGGKISGPTGLSGFQPAAWGAQKWAQGDLERRMSGIVDPATGQLTRQPQTEAEFAMAQSELEKWAQQQQTNQYNQAMGMLGFGSGTPMTGAGSGGSPGTPGFKPAPVQPGPGFTGDGQPMQVGGGQGFSMGQQAGGYQANAPLFQKFGSSMMGLLDKPGLSEKTIQDIVGRGQDELAEEEKSAALGLSERAAEAGAGMSGGAQSGMRELMSDFAGKRSQLAGDVRTKAEQDRLNRIETALGISGSYLGKVEDRSAADARYNAETQRADRNAAMGLMMGRQTSIPNLAGQGMKFNISAGFGGGANTQQGPGIMGGGTGNMSWNQQDSGRTMDAPRAAPTAAAGTTSRWGAPALSGQGGIMGMSERSGGGAGPGAGAGGAPGVGNRGQDSGGGMMSPLNSPRPQGRSTRGRSTLMALGAR